MSSKLLIETTAPLVSPFSDWKVEWVDPSGMAESLAESIIKQFETRLEESNGAPQDWGQLRESILQELKTLGSEKRLRVTGPAQIVDERNQNGRVYPGALWDQVLSENNLFMERLNNRTVLGECEHPEDGNTKLPRVSHLVEKVWRENNLIMATHLVFHTPAGQIVEELYKNGCSPGVSSRGTGSTKRGDNGSDIVEADGYVLDTWDFVYNPSVTIARPAMVEANKTEQTAEDLTEDRCTLKMGGMTGRDKVLELVYDMADIDTVTYEKKTDCVTLVGAASSLQNVLDQLSVKDLKYKKVAENEVDESTVEDLETGALAEDAEELQRHKGSEPNTQRNEAMTTALKEAADRTAAARAILDASSRVLDGEADLNGLLEQHENVSGALSGLSNILSEEYSSDKAQLNGALTERSAQLRREIDKARKSIVENVTVSTEDGTISEGHTEKVSQVTDVIEELATRNRTLRESRSPARRNSGVPTKKYETAIELGQGVVDRFKEHKTTASDTISDLRKRLRESQRRQSAATKLLESVVSRYRNNDVKLQVESLVANNPALERIQETLLECNSIGDLNRIVEKVIAPLSNTTRTSRRSDLPPVTRRRNLRESQNQPTTDKSSNLMESVLDKHGLR